MWYMYRDMGATKVNMLSFSPLVLPGANVRHVSDQYSEEFDFSDVFGPAPLPHTPLQLPSVAEDGDTINWCPEVRKDPLVIYSRSHSLVGPSPKPSLTRPQGKAVWDETDHIPANGDSSVSPAVSDVLTGGVAGLTFSDSGDSGSERDGDEDLQKAAENVGGKKLGPQDFELLRVVGQGAFGKVFQVQKKGTSEIYAMKVMRKEKILERNHGNYMKAERDILTKVVHPFIVQLQYSFQVCDPFGLSCYFSFKPSLLYMHRYHML